MFVNCSTTKKQTFECHICFEFRDMICFTSCGHAICEFCYRECVNCPICRKEWENINYIEVKHQIIKCQGCHTLLDSKRIALECGHMFCENCVKCENCHTPLSSKRIALKDGYMSCKNCVDSFRTDIIFTISTISCSSNCGSNFKAFELYLS